MGIRFLSLFSGIEAASCAWITLGWECIAVAEIEPFPSAVLAHHYPDVPNLGDITKITEEQIKALGHIDLVVGGFPCQDLSVAGKRAGLRNDDGVATRSGLFFTAQRIVEWSGARWEVVENVPGLFSSNGGRDFAAVVGAMAGCEFDLPRDGWRNAGVAAGPNGCVEWATLDAQFFGVPQRRRRVFLVRDTGNWRGRQPVLFERHSLQGHPAPSRETREGATYPVAPCIGASGRGFERTGDPRGNDAVVATFDRQSSGEYGTEPVASTVSARDYKSAADLVTHSLRGEGFDASEDGTGRGTPLVPICIQGAGHTSQGSQGSGINHDVSFTLNNVDIHAVAFAQTQRDEVRTMEVAGALAGEPGMKQQTYIAFSAKDHGADAMDNLSPTLRAGGHAGSHANAGVMPAVAFEPGSIARHAGPSDLSETVSTLRADMGDNQPAVLHALYNKGINHGENDDAQKEGNAGKILLRVRQEIGAKAFAQWGLGILDSLRTAKILRPEVHGEKFRQAPFSRSWVVCCALGSPLTRSEGAMQSLREACGAGCPPQGWGSLEQCADELGAYLSQLSQPGTQAERFMHDLWQADEGAGLLRQALSEIQNVGRSDAGEGKPAHQVMQVRRLTPLCCEFLQGFPRNYTLIPYRNKPAADGPRYKALGNSMAVPVMAFIGRRIQMVEELTASADSRTPPA